MSKFNWVKAIETTGNIAEIAVKTGIVAANPALAGVILGGRIIGGIIEDENENEKYLNELTTDQLLELEKAVQQEKKKRRM